MNIKKSIISEFKNEGITIRPYFEDDETWEAKIRVQELDELWNYEKGMFVGWGEDGKSIVVGDTKTREDFREQSKEFADRKIKNKWDDSTEIWVFIPKENVHFCIRNVGKYQEITREFIENKINRELNKYKSVYGDFCRKMRALLLKAGIDGGWTIYPTTYGIGIWSMFNWNAKHNAEMVEKLLKKYDIEYTNGWSDAKWVYRFRIAKKSVKEREF